MHTGSSKGFGSGGLVRWRLTALLKVKSTDQGGIGGGGLGDHLLCEVLEKLSGGHADAFNF